MKVTLDGSYAGGGGRQHIKITGELTGEGLGGSGTVDLSGVEDKLKALEDVVLALQAQVQELQAQNLQASVKELASALETLKTEQATPPAVVEPVTAESVVAGTSSKKKASTTTTV